MLTIQKNELFERIRRVDLDPMLFRLDDSADDLTTIKIAGLPLEFDVLRSDGSFNWLSFRYRRFAPGWPFFQPPKPRNYSKLAVDMRTMIDEEIEAGWMPVGKWCAFAEVATAFVEWLLLHAKPALAEATAPDLWTDAAASLPEFAELPTGETEPFSQLQQQQIRAAVQQFKFLIEGKFNPDSEQNRELTMRLDYLADAVARLNRLDWKSLALTTVIGAAITLSLDTQAGGQLWALFREALNAVSHLLGP